MNGSCDILYIQFSFSYGNYRFHYREAPPPLNISKYSFGYYHDGFVLLFNRQLLD